MRAGNEGISRRRFLEMAGATGATVTLAGGLGGVLAACGGETGTTTTAAGTPTTAAGTSTTAGTTPESQTTTSVAAAAEEGRELKIGFVTPLTGALASFGIPDKYCVERWTEAVADGLVCGDGKKHKISFLVRDTQSDSSRSAQVAGDLVEQRRGRHGGGRVHL